MTPSKSASIEHLQALCALFGDMVFDSYGEMSEVGSEGPSSAEQGCTKRGQVTNKNGTSAEPLRALSAMSGDTVSTSDTVSAMYGDTLSDSYGEMSDVGSEGDDPNWTLVEENTFLTYRSASLARARSKSEPPSSAKTSTWGRC